MSVVRYRKLPVEVDTIQWTGTNLDELTAFTGGLFIPVDPGEGLTSEYTGKVFDALHSTWVLVKTGQHVVCGVLGEFYPIAEDVLAETYELADATPDLRDILHTAIRSFQVNARKPGGYDQQLTDHILTALTERGENA
ncbi:hypothetical protein [Streptomyces sp. NPDC102476]|jgi:hypothetical protein|uniref:hypothetical protein n=1 Tax=Streptomyces sp. NPDC102476 TaxID=3366181 RepID=UPI003814AEAA